MLGLNIQNHINSALKNFNIEITPNSFCLFYSENDNQHVKDFTVNSEAKKNLIVKLNIYNNNNNKQPPSTPCVINVIVKTNIDDFICCSYHIYILILRYYTSCYDLPIHLYSKPCSLSSSAS